MTFEIPETVRFCNTRKALPGRSGKSGSRFCKCRAPYWRTVGKVSDKGINKKNVGPVAERIVSNELEFHGFRVSNLNKEGISANADLIAVKDGIPYQVQVKGASWTEQSGWWWGYGYCSEATIRGDEPMFNKHSDAFYKAQVVVLVSAKSPKDYSCLVLPVTIAERASQENLNREYRTPRKKDGGPKKPGPVWIDLDYSRRTSEERLASLGRERELLKPYRDDWDRAFCSQNG